jgi:mevalonate kinase
MERIDVKSGLNFVVRSKIPIAAGLGSSAAICVSTVAAINELFGGGLSKENICELAYEGEKIVHGSPSGVDNSISTYGGILRFERGKDVSRFVLEKSPPFVIGNTRRKRSTKRLVDRVRRLKERSPSLVTQLIDVMAEISEDGLKALKKSDYHKLGDLMNINHGLLASLGVSISKLDLLVHASRRSGAYGAKLTGAGGGGCIIAVSDESKIQNITRSIIRCRGVPHVVKISYDGVTTRRIE